MLRNSYKYKFSSDFRKTEYGVNALIRFFRLIQEKKNHSRINLHFVYLSLRLQQ
jgi:hypothetical protein